MLKALFRLKIIVCILLASPVFLGVRACSEPKEYCLANYESKVDQDECSNYCEGNKDFEGSERLVKACQNGQMVFLMHEQDSASNAALSCDRHYSSAPDSAKACRAGVNSEALRSSKIQKTPGTASDRENGR